MARFLIIYIVMDGRTVVHHMRVKPAGPGTLGRIGLHGVLMFVAMRVSSCIASSSNRLLRVGGRALQGVAYFFAGSARYSMAAWILLYLESLQTVQLKVFYARMSG